MKQAQTPNQDEIAELLPLLWILILTEITILSLVYFDNTILVGVVSGLVWVFTSYKMFRK